MTLVVITAVAFNIGLTALLLFSFYRYVIGLRYGERERRRMELAELNLAHLLQILDQPDTEWILNRGAGGRRLLFLDYSRQVKDDILRLLRTRHVTLPLLFYALVFFLSYYLLRLKARVVCARDDLKYLCYLGAATFRQVDATAGSE